MLCDKKLHPKLEEYELTKFLNMHSTNLIVGKPGSGKTSMIYSFMKSKKLLAKVYDKIYLFQPEQSRQSIVPSIFPLLIKGTGFNVPILEERVNEDFTNWRIQQIAQFLKRRAAKARTRCDHFRF
jgi:KaiC/GvpD/RAD55 family RecA-like ATPase